MDGWHGQNWGARAGRGALLATAFAAALALIALPGNKLRPALAAAGDLDPAFGAGGQVTTDFDGGVDRAFGMAIQKDRKIVAVGEVIIGGNRNFGVARYNPDGTLDLSFGAGGKVFTDFGGDADGAFGVAIQKDKKLVVVGFARVGGIFDFALAGYNPDGSLDLSFGTGGKVTTDFDGGFDQADDVALQKNGMIVVVGTARVGGMDDFALARYERDGTLDPSFGTGGTVTTDFDGGADFALALAVEKRGGILAAGGATVGASCDFALARYNPDGTLNPSLSSDGKLTTDFGGDSDFAFDVAVQKDRKIVAAGEATIGGTEDFALARYQPDGTLDLSFGSGGKVSTDFAGGDDEIGGLQKDGRIAAAGRVRMGTTRDFGLARYQQNGVLDASFGMGGKVTTDFPGDNDEAHALAIQKDGKLVAVGQTRIGGIEDFALARYLRR